MQQAPVDISERVKRELGELLFQNIRLQAINERLHAELMAAAPATKQPE